MRLWCAAGHEKDPHWDESAKNFIEGVILHVATEPRYAGRRNLLTVRDLIRTALAQEPAALVGEDEEPLHLLEKEMLQSAARFAKNLATEDLAGALEGAARDFYEKGANERAGVLSTVRRHTKFLDYTAMRRVLAGHDFDLADLKRDRNGVSVYLCLPASRMGLCNRWLRIFINQLLDAMEREKTAPVAPVLVCLDEFPVLGHMRQLRGRGRADRVFWSQAVDRPAGLGTGKGALQGALGNFRRQRRHPSVLRQQRS